MSKKLFFAAAAAVFAFAQGAKAQTNIQLFYDFAPDRMHVTTTVEGFYGDKWGNTFFFIDHDYNSKTADNHVYAPSGTYWEIARCINLWQDTAMAPLSAHIEYNGGVYNGFTINNAFLFGLDYFLHTPDFKNTLNLKLLGKVIDYAGATKADGQQRSSLVPLQFTAVWGMQDLFGVKGLRFNGFADFWFENHWVERYFYSDADKQAWEERAREEMEAWHRKMEEQMMNGGNNNFNNEEWEKKYEKEYEKIMKKYRTQGDSEIVFIAEPQLWYNVGQHFNVPNLHAGGELELSVDFAGTMGLRARPCLGLKWVF